MLSLREPLPQLPHFYRILICFTKSYAWLLWAGMSGLSREQNGFISQIMYILKQDTLLCICNVHICKFFDNFRINFALLSSILLPILPFPKPMTPNKSIDSKWLLFSEKYNQPENFFIKHPFLWELIWVTTMKIMINLQKRCFYVWHTCTNSCPSK